MADDSDWDRLTKRVIITSTSSASIAADEGYADVAKASLRIVNNVVLDLRPLKTPEKVTEHSIEQLKATVEDLERRMDEANIPRTQAFKCHADHDDYMKRASSKGERIKCGLTYAACLGEMLTSIIGR